MGTISIIEFYLCQWSRTAGSRCWLDYHCMICSCWRQAGCSRRYQAGLLCSALRNGMNYFNLNLQTNCNCEKQLQDSRKYFFSKIRKWSKPPRVSWRSSGWPSPWLTLEAFLEKCLLPNIRLTDDCSLMLLHKLRLQPYGAYEWCLDIWSSSSYDTLQRQRGHYTIFIKSLQH